jgi:NADH-quinone oxidoreductase subunit I
MYGFGLAKGLVVTMRNMILPSRMFTLHQYPNRKIGLLGLAKSSGTNIFKYVLREPRLAAKSILGLTSIPDKIPQHPRFRGQEFAWYENRCTGCASCAKYCPLGIIKIVTQPSGEDMQEGEKYAIDVFDIDIGRCMFCGLCVEACPYDAIHMGSGFEEAQPQRQNLIIGVDKLRSAPKMPSTWFRPQLEKRGYRPMDGKEATWEEVGRHEKPSKKNIERKWTKR